MLGRNVVEYLDLHVGGHEHRDGPLMKDVDFVAEPGWKVAIVGTTGA